MKLWFASLLLTVAHLTAFGQTEKIQILLLGSDHLNQVYHEDYPNTDVLTSSNQKQMQELASLIAPFQPDMIGIEDTPDYQNTTDSLYVLYRDDALDLRTLESGRREAYQLAFRIGKQASVDEITCVNYKGGTSQGILANGDNIERYQQEGQELRQLVMEKYAELRSGELSLKDYVVFLNQPATYQKVYHLRYITPAKVRNGFFENPDEMVDTAFVDPQYIGAELISVFKNRDYKIYSNIVVNQMAKKAKRILIVIGAGHLESLKSIFSGDPDYEVVNANDYLQP